MIVAILIAVWFYRLADSKNLNKFLWAAIGGLSFVIAQLILGVAIALLFPKTLENFVLQILVGILSGAAGVWIAYIALNKTAGNPNNSTKNNSDLIDDNF